MRKLAIIGGSGVQESLGMKDFTSRIIDTPFGKAKCEVGEAYGNQVAFLARHGIGHVLPPHKINYRANMWALKSLGTEEILGTTAVGSLNEAYLPGDFVVCDQFLDFTKNRINTFFNGENGFVAHVDFTEPYCTELRGALCQTLADLGIKYHPTGCYVCAEGPRYESKAEVKMFAQLGGDVVGMTNVPEVLLAREAEMCYANVSMITNMGTGISKTPLSHEEVLAHMEEMKGDILKVFDAFLQYPANTAPSCNCTKALADYGGFKLNSFNVE